MTHGALTDIELEAPIGACTILPMCCSHAYVAALKLVVSTPFAQWKIAKITKLVPMSRLFSASVKQP